jgi:hypothetical protein
MGAIWLLRWLILGIRKMGDLRLIANERPYGKFIATYSDGSGATIFALFEDDSLIDR